MVGARWALALLLSAADAASVNLGAAPYFGSIPGNAEDGLAGVLGLLVRPGAPAPSVGARCGGAGGCGGALRRLALEGRTSSDPNLPFAC